MMKKGAHLNFAMDAILHTCAMGAILHTCATAYQSQWAGLFVCSQKHA